MNDHEILTDYSSSDFVAHSLVGLLQCKLDSILLLLFKSNKASLSLFISLKMKFCQITKNK